MAQKVRFRHPSLPEGSTPHLFALLLVNEPGKLETSGDLHLPSRAKTKAGEQARYSEDVGGTTMFYRILGVKLQQYLGSDFASQTQQLGPRVLVEVLFYCILLFFFSGW